MHPLIRTLRRGGTPGLDAFVAAWGDLFDLLERLAATPQDPRWHAEGDVRRHTEMVLAECYALLADRAAHLDRDRRLALVLGAVLHDIAKPLTTRAETFDGQPRLVAPHHADRGRSYLAYRLLEVGLPYGVTRAVLALVGHHHDPKRLVLQDRPARDYRQLARLADPELLYWLALADMRGRRCADQAEQLELIELFHLFAEEYGVWGVADPYAEWRVFIHNELAGWDEATRGLVVANAIRDAEAGLISTPHEAIARSYGYRAAFARLVVMCGPSGAGKSQWIADQLPEYAVVSLDALREEVGGDRADQRHNGQVRQAAREALKGHLRRHARVVWDATGLRRDFRRAICGLGFDYHAHVTLVVFHLPEAELFVRNAARAHAVPPEALRHQLDTAEWPYATEAHRLLFVDGEGRVLAEEGS